jgi:hypothetical protein
MLAPKPYGNRPTAKSCLSYGGLQFHCTYSILKGIQQQGAIMAKQRADQKASKKIADMRLRLQIIADEKWNGVLARMAWDLHYPQPALWKTLAGGQVVSSRLLVSLATYTSINLHWLTTGKGPQYLEGEDAVRRGQGVIRPSVPVAKELLRGPTNKQPDRLFDPSTDPLGEVLTDTQYWLKVGPSSPITRKKDEQIRPGDWLLLETDRTRFPPIHKAQNQLVVVPATATDFDSPLLGRVEEVDKDLECLDVELLRPAGDRSQPEEEIVTRRLPDGKFHTFVRYFVWDESKRRKGRRVRRPATTWDLEQDLTQVKYADVLAFCILLLRRWT